MKLHPLWLLVSGWWAWLVWACAGEWTSSADYGHGWLVLPLALYFLWKRAEHAGACDAQTGAGDWRGAAARAFVALSVLLVGPLEIVRQTPIHWRPILWAIGLLAAGNTLAVAWLTGGPRRLRVFLFPSLFMLVGIPWPTFVEGSVSFPLMQAVTGWSVGWLHLLGYPATAAGTTIALPNCTVGVEEACSGLRSLQAALMVGLAAGELARLASWARAALLAVAFAMAIAGNQARVLLLAMAGIGGGHAAVEQMHDSAGYLVLAVLLAGVGLAAWGLGRVGGGSRKSEGGGQRAEGGGWRAEAGGRKTDGGFQHFSVSAFSGRGAGAWLVFGVAVLAFLAAHGWFLWRASLAPRAVPPMLAPSGGGGFIVDENVPETILGVLRPDRASYIREEAGGKAARVVGYHFYWAPREGNANQLYHRPDACMPGAGWRIDGPVTRETIRIGGRDFAFNVFPFRGPAGPALMLWGSFLNGEPSDIEFNTDVYLNTANLWQFIRTGTRTHSYEVAACILPYADGHHPTHAELEAYAARVFSALADGG